MIRQPNCSKRRCKFYWGCEARKEWGPVPQPICEAFPDGIPYAIAFGKNKHLKPFLGDNGIRYERYTG